MKLHISDNTTPCTEVNFPLPNSERNTADNPAISSPTLSDVSQPIKMFMGLSEKITNELESLQGACGFENELNEEKVLIPCDHFSEMFPTLEFNVRRSDTCGCDILLDSTLLSNDRCIWHGITS